VLWVLVLKGARGVQGARVLVLKVLAVRVLKAPGCRCSVERVLFDPSVTCETE